MKKITAILICILLLVTAVVPLSAFAKILAIQTIKISGLTAPTMGSDPNDYVSNWKVSGSSYYIKDSYSGVDAGIYYMDESDNRKPAVNFKESDEYVYFLPIGFNSGYSVLDSTEVQLEDSDTPLKVEIYPNTSTNVAQVIVYYKVLPPADTPEITFNANCGTIGGSDSTSMKTDHNGFLTVTPQNPARDGYTFTGWYTSAEDGVKVDVETYKFLQDTTVYAHWDKAIDKIELSNVVLPMPGRKPVFATVLPDDAEYYIGLESWYYDNAGTQIYNDTAKNDTLEDYEKLTLFTQGQWYTYKCEIDAPISADTKLYINGEEQNFYISGRMICVDFEAKEPEVFTVYGESTILFTQGVNGDLFNFSLKDYVGGLGLGASFTTQGKPLWMLEELATWSLKGTRQTDSSSHEVTVKITSDSQVKELTLLIAPTKEQPFIDAHPQSVSIKCGEEATFRVKVKGASAGTQYSWKIMNNGLAYNAETTGYDVSGYNTDTFKIKSTNIADELKVKCEIKINEGLMLTTILATVKVKHSFGTCTPIVSGGITDTEVHSSKCSVCNESFEVSHTKKWKYDTLPYGAVSGTKYWTCVDCGHNSDVDFFDVPSATDQITCYFSDNYSGNAATGKIVLLNSYIDFPVTNPSREGYVFIGWALSPDAKEPDYVKGEKIFIGETGMKFYAVWAQPVVAIDGVVVTEENKDDVSGYGGIMYDSTTGTLTLDNAYVTTEEFTVLKNSVSVYAKDYLEIKLIGYNYISCDISNAYGVEVDGILKISGDGSLEFSDDGVEVAFDSAIKADKVIFDGGYTYIKDCRTAVNGDAHFTGGICESYIGLYDGVDYCAYKGNISWASEDVYYAGAAEGSYQLATQKSPVSLTKNEEYIVIAPFEGTEQIIYNEDRDTIMMLGSFEDVSVYIARYETGGNFVDADVITYAPTFTEMEAEYMKNADPETSGVKVIVWEQGRALIPVIRPFIIGIIE